MRGPDASPTVRPPRAGLVRPEPAFDASTVLAVIVTYHPDAGVGDRMRPLIGTVGAILFVDNCSQRDEIAALEPLLREDGVHLLQNERNVGLATALNQGFRWAADRGYAWVLTLDQDTEPTPAVVPEAARVLAGQGDRRIAVIGAGYGDRTAAASSSSGSDVACVITAGAFHSLGAWQHLGGFRDDFFIDYVDFEFCLRARANGYAIVQASEPTITQSIGRPTRRRLLIWPTLPTNHDRSRRYFITRNRVVVWRRYWRRERRWVASDFARFVRESVKIALFEEDRPGKLRAVVRGCRDGIRGHAAEGSPSS
jgi:rhamnosyltransferase